MSIIEIDNFRFRQYEVQSRGGICCGISIAMLAYLVEQQCSKSLNISAVKEFQDA
jgi:hypothetical protein